VKTLVNLTRKRVAKTLPLVGLRGIRLPEELSADSNIPQSKIDSEPTH